MNSYVIPVLQPPRLRWFILGVIVATAIFLLIYLKARSQTSPNVVTVSHIDLELPRTQVEKTVFEPEGVVAPLTSAGLPSCVPIPIGALLTGKLILLPTVLNNALTELAKTGAFNTPTLSATSIAVNSFTFDTNRSNICGTTINLDARMAIRITNAQVVLFAPISLGTVNLIGNFIVTGEVISNVIRITNLRLNDLSIASPDTPDGRAITAIWDLFKGIALSYVNNLLANVASTMKPLILTTT